MHLIFDRRRTAHLNTRRTKCLFAGHSCLHLLFDGSFDKALQLFIKFAFQLLFLKQGAEAVKETSQKWHRFHASRILVIAAICRPHSWVSVLSFLRPASVRL